MGFFDKTRQIAAAKQAVTDSLKPTTDLASLSSLPALTTPLNLSLGVAPMPHQEVPVQAVREGHRSLLIGDEMGVGKTLTAIAVVEELTADELKAIRDARLRRMAQAIQHAVTGKPPRPIAPLSRPCSSCPLLSFVTGSVSGSVRALIAPSESSPVQSLALCRIPT